MASIRYYQNGAGGSVGADFAVLKNTYRSGNYIYVGNAVSGASDANAGTERTKPLATIGQANTNSAAGDTVVVLAGHNETVTSSVVLSKAGVTIAGEGSGTLVPRFTCNAAIAMLDITAAGVQLDNLYFPASTAVPTARVRVGAAFSWLRHLQFDCGASDTVRALSYVTGAGTARFTDSRFTAVAATPAVGLEVINAITDLAMDIVTFDAGSFQWSDYAWKGSAAITRLKATRIYQFAGSHILFPTTTTGDLQIAGATGDSRVDWTV